MSDQQAKIEEAILLLDEAIDRLIRANNLLKINFPKENQCAQIRQSLVELAEAIREEGCKDANFQSNSKY